MHLYSASGTDIKMLYGLLPPAKKPIILGTQINLSEGVANEGGLGRQKCISINLIAAMVLQSQTENLSFTR